MLLLAAFIAGCGQAARQSELWQHDSFYKDWGHLAFSWGGYKSNSADLAQRSQDQGWWGIEIPYIPAQ